MARARARWAGATRAEATAPAFGVKAAAPAAATTRVAINVVKFGASAEPRLATASMTSAPTSSARRGTRASTVARTGESRA
ncbi:hypothetical protein GCM10022254_11510 [Actinomadura meridiana]|uniref:Uncharacterized protein n=1 Tax=Actinomadura meridiana TaxID=559626 RepID=A0ABP8BU89_9ACTN